MSIIIVVFITILTRSVTVISVGSGEDGVVIGSESTGWNHNVI